MKHKSAKMYLLRNIWNNKSNHGGLGSHTERSGGSHRQNIKLKAPMSDCIQNFWFKKFTSIHQLTKCFTYLLEHPPATPDFLQPAPLTFYLRPSRSRITHKCLPSIYKILTSIRTSKVPSGRTQVVRWGTKEVQKMGARLQIAANYRFQYNGKR